MSGREAAIRTRQIPMRALLAAASVSFVLAAVAPPWLTAHGFFAAGQLLRSGFSAVCHQQPQRSFVLFGSAAAVCARCLGIYAGAAAGAFVRLGRSAALRLFAIVTVANVCDVAAQAAGVYGNLPLMRFGLGALLGTAAAALLASRFPALAEQGVRIVSQRPPAR